MNTLDSQNLFEQANMSCRSVLTYPGSKSKVAKDVHNIFGNLGCTEVVSPFHGGGSVELYMASRGISVYAGDAFRLLVEFWQTLKGDPQRVAKCVSDELHRIGYKPEQCENQSDGTIYELRQMAIRCSVAEVNPIVRAACFYIRNQTSYSGLMFKYGNDDKTIALKKTGPNITDTMIQRLSKFNTTVQLENVDYHAILATYPDLPVYCDPPYFGNTAGLQKEKIIWKLYGIRGNLNLNFDHQEFYDAMSQRNTQWIISYDNVPQIRELYKDYKIIECNWTYAMTKDRQTNHAREILIVKE